MEETSKVGVVSPCAKDGIPKETSDMAIDQKPPEVASATAIGNMTATKGEILEGKDDQEEKKVDLEELEKEEKKILLCLGPRVFGPSTEMFDYFMKLLHSWSSNVSVNKVIFPSVLFCSFFYDGYMVTVFLPLC